MEYRNGAPLSKKFKSGVSFGAGLTYQLDTVEVNGVTYMDTPGLDDIEMRKKAAEAITHALKQDGSYRVMFVLTLEAGRIKPNDITTMNLVLDSAPEITNYGVVFNKIPEDELKMIPREGKQALLTQVSARTTKGESKPLPIPLFVAENKNLKSKTNATTTIPGLEDFVLCLPPLVIHSGKVKEISTESFDEMREKLEEQLSHYKRNQEALEEQMKNDKEDFKRQYKKMEEENQRRHQLEKEKNEELQRQYKKEMEEMENQNKQDSEEMKALKIKMEEQQKDMERKEERNRKIMEELQEKQKESGLIDLVNSASKFLFGRKIL